MAGFTDPEVLLEVKPQPPNSTSGGGAAATDGGGGPLDGLRRALAAAGAPLLALAGRASSDPFYGVVAYRNFRREDA